MDNTMGSSPGDLAEVAADALRRLNHATFEPPHPSTPGWSAPADVARVLESVMNLVERVPQTLKHAGDALAKQSTYLQDDRPVGQGVTDTVQDALMNLDRARVHLHAAARALDHGVEHTNHLRILYGVSRAPDPGLGR